ncbi:nucleotidyltransferase family protein [Nitrospira sp. M1]
MNTEGILSVLQTRHHEISNTFGVKSLGLFGSAARQELRHDSDIDILVEFDGPATFDGYMNFKFYLEGLFNRSVDLVIDTTIKPRMRSLIEKDLIHVS